MAKRQHFLNSKVATLNMEPVYSDLFDVIITPPDLIAANPEWSGIGKEILLEEVTGITGLNVDLMPSNVTQKFRGTDRNFIAVVPDGTSVSFSISFELNLNEANENFVYNAFRKWSDLQYDPLTGAQLLKRDYVSPAGVSMTAFNKLFDVHRKIEVKNVFLDGPIDAFDKDFGGNTIEKLTMNFIGDYFNNAYTGQ
jgi:hypothetical protein